MISTDDQAELLSAVVGTIHAIHDDINKIRQAVDLIRQAQIEHGKALADLQIQFDRHQWATRSSTTPTPISVAK